VVVPPADEPLLHLPIDGLPALLQELSEGGVDVTVIAGPPLLEEADATIVAWATRNVLWAMIPGEVTRAEARAAAARMELAGVTPFGVVMVEPHTAGV
jgi:Mrp family chromosome partitioning ATPase